MPARYSKAFRKAAGILKHPVAPHDQWHIDCACLLLQYLLQNCSLGARGGSGRDEDMCYERLRAEASVN